MVLEMGKAYGILDESRGPVGWQRVVQSITPELPTVVSLLRCADSTYSHAAPCPTCSTGVLEVPALEVSRRFEVSMFMKSFLQYYATYSLPSIHAIPLHAHPRIPPHSLPEQYCRSLSKSSLLRLPPT